MSLLTSKEVCEILGCTPNELKNFSRRDRNYCVLPPKVRGSRGRGGFNLYEIEEVRKFKRFLAQKRELEKFKDAYKVTK